jgi:hypothetical protein
MEQTARDNALVLQRDYRTFNLIPTTELSNRVPMLTGYIGTPGRGPQNITWAPGSEVDAAFTTLEQLLTQLAQGTYQTPAKTGGKNPGIWPVKSINWVWIMSLYAYINPAYAAWLVTNNYTIPNWLTHP